MFWSVKSTVLNAKDENFKPAMGAQTRIYVALSRFWSLEGHKWMGVVLGVEGFSESVNTNEHL